MGNVSLLLVLACADRIPNANPLDSVVLSEFSKVDLISLQKAEKQIHGSYSYKAVTKVLLKSLQHSLIHFPRRFFSIGAVRSVQHLRVTTTVLHVKGELPYTGTLY